ncbi:MAG: hypothetical protein LBC85_10360 [Fibromonadaceae bacterium]|jgi:gas vesicle protein|nr:hypothetical protein [Fibromonadaceae bacterium]
MHTPSSQSDLEAMKGFAIDFFLKDIENLKLFIKKMQEDFGQKDLVFILKMFVLNQNKVFNMAEFMKKQSELVEESVKKYNKDSHSEKRRNALNQWVKDNAALYRKNTIFDQLYCIDNMSAEIIPAIEKAIKE